MALSDSAPSSDTKLEDGVEQTDGSQWLKYAKDCYGNAIDYVQSSRRNIWERNVNMFHNQHPSGSKYNSDAFKRRSRLFRPKIRSVVRKNEAATAQAFFSTQDVVNVTPQNDNDPTQLASANVMLELLNYRLQKTIPWFRILVGARQTADVYGICAVKTWWKYRAEDDGEDVALDDMGIPTLGEDGKPIVERRTKVVEDEPCIEPLEPENVLFDSGADWLDPVNSSPYLILRRPMFVHEVKGMMERDDPKTGAPAWKKLDDDDLKSGRELDENQLDDARDKYDGQDRYDRDRPVDDYEVVWVHENFMRRDGVDYQYYTLSTHAMLTDPRPVQEVYFHCNGDRPVVVGYSNIEAFRPYPASRVETLGPLQQEANDLANLRMDALKFSLTPMVKIRRGSKALVPAFLNRSPGKVVEMDDPVNDAVEMNPPQVNSQAWSEQDRINVDFDELAGNFSMGSVQTNRAMNETVGGMSMISGQANALVEYDLRVFTETFVEPVLRQMVKLEQAYETDAVVLALAAEKAQLWQRFGIDRVTDELLSHSLSVTVNVGIGATDPMMQGRKFPMAMQTFGQIVMPLIQMNGPGVMESPGVEAIATEIFGKAGYKDGQRFLNFKNPNGEDPQVQQAQQQVQMAQQQMQQMMQVIQQLQAQVEDKNAERQFKLMDTQMKGQQAVQKQTADIQGKAALAEQTFKLDLARNALLPNPTNVNVM